jgi:LPXTG-site transpeptidase (sortase) family protein
MNKFKKDYLKTKKSVIKKIQSLGTEKIKGLRLLLIGTTLIFGLSIIRISQEVRLSFNTQPQEFIALKNPPPKSIRLPRFKITLDIALARITDGVWSIDEQRANYLVTSASPGNEGNIVIYGHNSNEVFGPLRWTDVGDEIVVTNSDEVEFKYIVAQIEEVSPDEINWLNPKDTETLTLYTCAGFLNTKRHLVIAYPKVDQTLDIGF